MLGIRSYALVVSVLVSAACDSAGTSQGDVVAADTNDVFVPTEVGDVATSQPETISLDTASPNDTSVPQDTAVPNDTTVAQDTSVPNDTNVPNDTTPNDTSVPNDVGNDTTTPTTSIGAACDGDADCGSGGLCLGLPGGYCSIECSATECPGGASCWGLGEDGSFCLKDCASSDECRGGDGYICDADDTCWVSGVTGGSPVGGPCEADGDCADAGAFCYPAVVDGDATGFFLGYCLIADCTANSCPSGSVCAEVFSGGGTGCVDSCGTANNGCNQGYGCFDPGICFPSCAESGCPTNYACDAELDWCLPSCSPNSCGAGLVCKADGTCGEPPCTANSCGAGYLCAPSGECVPDLTGGPGAGPGPTCDNLPPRDCTANCGDIVAFEPDEGPGYWDYPINGETSADEYRSYARRDLMMLIKWATAVVDCKAAAWAGGNNEPLGLGDMSESNGNIPGTRVGSPGHPEGTHEDGYDMDIAYYQSAASADNRLRPICPYTQGGQDAYHCTGQPNTLDVWRTAMFIGLLFQSPRTRVIGVDGKVGPLVEQAIDVLCGNNWLTGTPCTQSVALAFETTDEGMGWYYFHHHHLHISLKHLASGAPSIPGARECLVPGCGPAAHHHEGPFGDGVATRKFNLLKLIAPID